MKEVVELVLLCIIGIMAFIFGMGIANAKTIRVAVLDSGYNLKNNNLTLCKSGHIDFTNTGYNDNYGHGQNVSHLIERGAKKTDYCQIIYKIFDPKMKSDPAIATIKAFMKATKEKVDVINYSAGGASYSIAEAMAVKDALTKGILIVTAAGNESRDMGKICNYYPACHDPRIVVVGNLSKKSTRYYLHPSSNFGRHVDIYVVGTKVTAGGLTLTGTSQSTAIVTGKFVSYLGKKRRTTQSTDSKAVQKIMEASYTQSGLDKKVDAQLEKLRKILPDNMKYVVPVGKTLIERKVEWNYDF